MSKLQIKCCNCGKKISMGEAYPAYNHPEAPPICFNCLPEEVKETLQKHKPCDVEPHGDNTPEMSSKRNEKRQK